MSVLENKVVIVTGAGRGIGRAIAMACAAADARVVVADTGVPLLGVSTNASIAEEVVAEIAAHDGAAVPATDSVATKAGALAIVDTALSNWGRVDGLVCCAAVVRHGPFLDLSEQDFDDVIGVHLKGHFLMYQATLSAMIDMDIRGSLIGISSGYVLGDPNRAPYRSAKAGIVALTKSVAHLAAEHGARANVIAPIANTRLTEAANLKFDSEPEDIAPMAVYLLSDRSAGINGEIFSVKGNELSSWEDPYERRTARNQTRWKQSEIDEVIPWLRSGTNSLPPVPPLPEIKAAAPKGKQSDGR